MKQTRKKEFPYFYAPNKKLFHMVVKMTDRPGSLSSILDALSGRLNFLGTTTYTMLDNTAVFSGFAEALSSKETAASLKEAVMSTKAAVETDVMEGSEGLLVDSFHTGLEVQGDGMVMLRTRGLSKMINRINKLLGSGGDALLYEEGRSMGRANGENLTKLLGVEGVKKRGKYLRGVHSSLGFGRIEAGKEDAESTDGPFSIIVSDCFECSENDGYKTNCSFHRGYLSGLLSIFYDKEFDSKEVRCVLRGDKVCEHMFVPRP